MSLINDALKRAKQAQAQKPPERPLGVNLEPVSANGLRGLPVWLIPVVIVVCLIAASGLLYYGWNVSKRTQQASAKTPTPSTPPAASLRNDPTTAPGSATVSPTSAPVPTANPATLPAAAKVATTPRQPVQVETNLVTRTTLVAAAQASVETTPVAPPAKPPQPTATANEGSPATKISVPPTSEPAQRTAATKPVEVSTPPKSEATSPPPVSTTSGAATASPPTAPATPSTPPARPANAATQPSTSVAQTPSEPVEWPALKLQGIFYRLARPSASINGKTVWLGDTVEGAKVIRIERQAVYLEIRGQHKILFLP